MRGVCVFCGSSEGSRPAYGDAAAALGRQIAQVGLRLVYGGACVGLMGRVADAALEEGGEVVGVIPDALVEREVVHHGLSKLLVVDSMHSRKARMAELADAFVVLPGGLGTLEETFEVWTWAQLGLHDKPIGLLDVEGYWEPLATLLDHAVEEGFVRPVHRALLMRRTDPEHLLQDLANYPGRGRATTPVLEPDQT